MRRRKRGKVTDHYCGVSLLEERAVVNLAGGTGRGKTRVLPLPKVGLRLVIDLTEDFANARWTFECVVGELRQSGVNVVVGIIFSRTFALAHFFVFKHCA